MLARVGAHEDIARLREEATASMKSDAKGAVAKLESAYRLALGASDAADAAEVAEDLARGWARRRSPARAIYFARQATRLAPVRKAAWTTLAKTCELIATQTKGEPRAGRARALFRAAASAFEKAASMTKDREDKLWLLELARDAAKESSPPKD